jgi:hypothetical protein
VQLSKDDLIMMISEAEAVRTDAASGRGREGVDMRTFLHLLTNCPWY